MSVINKAIAPAIILFLALSFNSNGQDKSIKATDAKNYLENASSPGEAEGIWDMSIVSSLTVSDSLASKSDRNNYGSYIILRTGRTADFRKSYDVYTIDTTDYSIPLEFQGRLTGTSLPGIYNFIYYFADNLSARGIATLSQGRIRFDIVYPDTIVKRIFKENYIPEIGVSVSLLGKKRFPPSIDIIESDGMVMTYLDSSYRRVKDKSLAAYYRKVKLNQAGNPEGLCTIYSMGGTPVWQSALGYYDPDDSNADIPVGRCSTWYPDGKIESARYYNRDGMVTDTLTKWYENGRCKFLACYKDDVSNGVYRTWFEDGSPEVEAVFSDNNLAGNAYTIFNEEGQERRVFYEGFKNNLMGWPETESKDLTIVVDDQEMKISNNSRKATYPCITAPFDPKWNYELECAVAASGCRDELFYGVVFGKTEDDRNYQFFAVNKKGEYVAGQCLDGKTTQFAEPQISAALHKDGTADTLSVKTFGGMVYYSVNGEDVFNTFKKELKGNGLGGYITGKGEFSYGEFSLVVNKFADDADVTDDDE